MESHPITLGDWFSLPAGWSRAREFCAELLSKFRASCNRTSVASCFRLSTLRRPPFVRIYEIHLHWRTNVLKYSHRNCLLPRGSWRPIVINNPRLFFPGFQPYLSNEWASTKYISHCEERATIRPVAKCGVVDANVRNTSAALSPVIFKLHPPVSSKNMSEGWISIEDSWACGKKCKAFLLENTVAEFTLLCWCVRLRYFYLYPAYFFFFVSVLRHMGIDRPAPGTGYVLTTLVNVVILLI